MKLSPAFQFYPHDFLVGTAEFTAEEVGAYIRLLCYQWAKNGLPNDNLKLAQLAICGVKVIESIRQKFRECEDGLLRNPRLQQVQEDQERYRLKQTENGKKGGNPNFHKGQHNPYYKPEDNPLHNPKISSISSPISSSLIISKKEEVAKAPSVGIKRQFTDAWCNAYEDKFGCKYKFQGAKDGKAADSLLSLERSIEDIISLAKQAWDKPDGFNTKQASSLAGFSSRFNEIFYDLKAFNQKAEKNTHPTF